MVSITQLQIAQGYVSWTGKGEDGKGSRCKLLLISSPLHQETFWQGPPERVSLPRIFATLLFLARHRGLGASGVKTKEAKIAWDSPFFRRESVTTELIPT